MVIKILSLYLYNILSTSPHHDSHVCMSVAEMFEGTAVPCNQIPADESTLDGANRAADQLPGMHRRSMYYTQGDGAKLFMSLHVENQS